MKRPRMEKKTRKEKTQDCEEVWCEVIKETHIFQYWLFVFERGWHMVQAEDEEDFSLCDYIVARLKACLLIISPLNGSAVQDLHVCF
jgi:hypothetical protein